MKKQALLILSFLLFLTAPAISQKYGYLNLGNLLEEMPERQAADAELKTYREQLAADGDVLVKKFEEDTKKLYEDMQQGLLSKVAQQERQAALQKQQEKIYAFDTDFRAKVQKKRQDLLLPILEKVDKAVRAVAEENDFTMIFDSSVINSLLFAEDSADVTALVKAKLEME